MDPNTVYRYASVDAWRLETHCNDIAVVATWDSLKNQNRHQLPHTLFTGRFMAHGTTNGGHKLGMRVLIPRKACDDSIMILANGSGTFSNANCRLCICLRM